MRLIVLPVLLLATLARAQDPPTSTTTTVPPAPEPASQSIALPTAQDQAVFDFLKARLIDKAQAYQAQLREIDAFATPIRDRLKLDTGWTLDISTGKFVPRPATTPTTVPEAPTGSPVP